MDSPNKQPNWPKKDDPMYPEKEHIGITVSPDRYKRLQDCADETGLPIEDVYAKTMGVPAEIERLKQELGKPMKRVLIEGDAT